MFSFHGILGFLTLLPYIVAGAEKLHAGKTGEDKKNAVMQLAGTALAGVTAASPEAGQIIGAAMPEISTAIDGIVGTLNALGIFGHKAAAPVSPPAPAAQ